MSPLCFQKGFRTFATWQLPLDEIREFCTERRLCAWAGRCILTSKTGVKSGEVPQPQCIPRLFPLQMQVVVTQLFGAVVANKLTCTFAGFHAATDAHRCLCGRGKASEESKYTAISASSVNNPHPPRDPVWIVCLLWASLD